MALTELAPIKSAMPVTGSHLITTGSMIAYTSGMPNPCGATAVKVPMLTPINIAAKTSTRSKFRKPLAAASISEISTSVLLARDKLVQGSVQRSDWDSNVERRISNHPQPSVVRHKWLYFGCHSERSEESRLSNT